MRCATIVSESEEARFSRSWTQISYLRHAAGNHHSKRCALVFRADNRKFCIVHFSNPFCDRQAQPTAFNLTTRRIRAIEAVEDMRKIGLRYTDTAVADL